MDFKSNNFSLITGKNTVRQNHYLKAYKYFIELTVSVIHNYAHAYTLIVIICYYMWVYCHLLLGVLAVQW